MDAVADRPRARSLDRVVVAGARFRISLFVLAFDRFFVVLVVVISDVQRRRRFLRRGGRDGHVGRCRRRSRDADLLAGVVQRRLVVFVLLIVFFIFFFVFVERRRRRRRLVMPEFINITCPYC